MIGAKLSFRQSLVCDAEQVEEAVDSLTACLRNNGQILGREQPSVWEGNTLHAHVLLPAADALAKSRHNKYVARGFERLRKAGVSKISIKIFDDPSESEEVHSHKASSYVLFTTYVMLASPLKCGDCFEPLPLYTIPPTYDQSEYYDVLTWESDYQACDTLQMHCRTGERFALRQMGDPESSLSKQGRDICDRITRSTDTPTYYYLHRYVRRTTLTREEERRCPVCGGDWRLTKRWHLFDFRCDRCRLVSNVSCTVSV